MVRVCTIRRAISPGVSGCERVADDFPLELFERRCLIDRHFTDLLTSCPVRFAPFYRRIRRRLGLSNSVTLESESAIACWKELVSQSEVSALNMAVPVSRL